MAGWDTLRSLVQEELVQAKQEGRSAEALDALRPALEQAGDDAKKLHEIYSALTRISIPDSFPFKEPSDLPGIQALRPSNPPQMPVRLNEKQLFDRMYGAWLGRCVGCALGKPVECFMGPHAGVSSRDRIKTYLAAVGSGEYPLQDYFPEHSPAEARTGRVGCQASTREHIAFMETDDDIRYTVIGQIILREKSADFTSWDVAFAWMQHLPYRAVCTAETQAYRNLVNGYDFHCNIPAVEPDWQWVSTHYNPYREWIGAQIRADSWGYAAPGNPQLAAEFAWRDARISHVKNGIYGEMFVAAMIAAAFTCDDVHAIITAGLAQIPSTSRLFKAVQEVVAICEKYRLDPQRFEMVLDEIYALLGQYHPVHTINNAALVVAGLLLGGRDFGRAITIAVMGGWDTDCNGATVGSIMGAMLGATRLPVHWTARLHDRLHSGILDYNPIAISECARRSVAIASKIMPIS